MYKKRLQHLTVKIMALLLLVSNLSINSAAGVHDDYANNLIYSAYDLYFPTNNSNEFNLPASALNDLKILTEGTILVRFTPQLSGLHSLVGLSNGQTGYPNSYFNFYISSTRLGFEIRQQSDGDYEKKYVDVSLESGQEYYAAITADPDYGYRLFLDGELVLDWKNSQLTSALGYGFLNDIPEINAGTIGKTKRVSNAGSPPANEYLYHGEIESIEIYDLALPVDRLEEETAIATPSGPTNGLIYEAANLHFPLSNANGLALPQPKVNTISTLNQGTIMVKFTPQLVGIQSLLGISNGQDGFANSHFHLYVRDGQIGFEIRKQNGGDYQKSSVNVDINSGEEQYLAMTADPTYGYKLFLNGEKILDLPNSRLTTALGYGFINDIPGIDTGLIGQTKRTLTTGNANEYQYHGDIALLQIYGRVLEDDELEAETATVLLPGDENGLVYSAADLNFPVGNAVGMVIPQDQLDDLSTLDQGTILVKFTPQLSGIQSLLGISNGTDGFANSYFHLYVREGKVGFEIRRQSGGDYQKSSVDISINSGEEQYLAMTADPDYGYKLFLNGQKILDLPNAQLSTPLGYGFISAIPDLNSGLVGRTKRTLSGGNVNEYQFSGDISNLKIYNHALDDSFLLTETSDIDPDTYPVRKFNLFNEDDWNSPAFRIPSMLTTDNGVVIAAADIRFGDSNDSPNNIDTGILTSNDGGVTWSNPRLILNFLDYPNTPTSQVMSSASFIDCVMVQGDNNRVFLFVDVMKGGVGQAYTIPSSGYTTVNNEKRLILTNANNDVYTVGSDNIVYDGANLATAYSVGPQFELRHNGVTVSNIFYANSPLGVLPTTFVCMIYSDDDGQTWSDPQLMNGQLKTDDMIFFGVAPGVGIQIENGLYAGRLVVPFYYTSTLNTTEFACVVYSDDNGQTWTRGASPNDNRLGGPQKLHESQIIEMPDGQLKMFARNLGKASIATSFDGGATWHNVVEDDNTLIMSTTTGCQLSIINYSQPINGKPAVIFSNPAATARKNGAVRVGLIETDGIYGGTNTIADGRTKYRIDWVSGKVIRSGEFAYSCLTELPNHNIANLYEENNTRFTLDHLVYAEYTLEYLMGDALD